MKVLAKIAKAIKWRIQKLLRYRPSKSYKDVFEYQLSNKKNVLYLKKIDSASVFYLKLPLASNIYLPPKYEVNFFKAYPDAYLSCIKHCKIGMVDFRVGVITEDNGIILDLSPDHMKKKIHPFFTNENCIPQRKLKGKTLVLAAPSGKGNYYHWMFHIIGRLSILKSQEIDINSFDYIVVNRTYAKFQEESLIDFNISAEKIVYIDNDEFIKVDEATIPSYLYFHPMVPHFLKRHYLTNNIKPTFDKIYISRRKSSIRKMINEDALVEMLTKEFGYNEVFLEDLSLKNQAIVLNGAKYVIAPHGAGVPNTIYCEPKTKLLEIIPNSWINVIYWIYSEYSDLDYYVFFAGEKTEKQDGYLDFTIDIHEFKKYITQHSF